MEASSTSAGFVLLRSFCFATQLPGGLFVPHPSESPGPSSHVGGSRDSKGSVVANSRRVHTTPHHLAASTLRGKSCAQLLDLISLADVDLSDFQIHCATGKHPSHPLEAWQTRKNSIWLILDCRCDIAASDRRSNSFRTQVVPCRIPPCEFCQTPSLADVPSDTLAEITCGRH